MDPTTLQTVRDLVAIAAALTGIFVALRGLATWRHQLRANTGLDVARKLLRAAYQVDDAIRQVRNPFFDIREIETATRKFAEESKQRHDEVRKRWERPVYAERWPEMIDAGSEFRAAIVEAKILWGIPASEAVHDLEIVIRDLSVALGEYLRYSEMSYRAEAQEAMRELYRVTLQAQGKDDPFTSRIESAVAQIEAFARPKISLGLK